MFTDLFINQRKVSFSAFVNYALYSSNGYYNKDSKISKNGDFLTSPTISKIYGQTLAYFLNKEIILKYNNDSNINLIELGSNEGILMSHVVDYIKKYSPGIYKKLKIILIERNSNLHKKINKNLSFHNDKLIVETSIEALSVESKTAIIFCNEFFDALPFERCVLLDEKLYQINIYMKNGEILESLDLLDSNLHEKFSQYNLKCADNIFFEFPVLEYEKYFELLSKKFKNIFFLINDYGNKSDFFHSSPDPFGTSRCFFEHKVSRDFYQNIFNQDITHDVNFSFLSLVAKKFNFKEDNFFSQTKFFIDNDDVMELWTEKEYGALKKLVPPNSMGEKFKFILFKR